MRVWLLLIAALIACMVMLGGVTRLTGSGLSMVQWRPLMGALPPMDEAEWQRVFAMYQRSPQFQQVNAWMDLASFKQIFFWEYLHRLVGRLLGVVAILPWAYFTFRKRLPARTSRGVLIAVVLGVGQGLLGWYMVRSGLADVPHVSHFRLAAHLCLALSLYCWVLWLYLDLRFAQQMPRQVSGKQFGSLGLLALLTIAQIVYGAFMAGKRAGLMADTFPDMNGYYWPEARPSDQPLVHALTHDPWLIHYIHRGLAWAVALLALGVWISLRRDQSEGALRGLLPTLPAVVALQFTLGALTVLFHVPVALAVAHQGGAILLLSTLCAHFHRIRVGP